MHLSKIAVLSCLLVLLTKISLGQNVVENPTGNQTITQPSGTLLNVNRATVANLNGTCTVDGVTYTTIVSAYSDTNCKAVRVPANYSGESLSANWQINRANIPIIFDGCSATITQGTHQILVTADQVSILSNCPHGMNDSGGSAINFAGYTGTDSAVKVGSTTADTRDFYMKGIKIDMTSSGSGAVGLKMLRTNNYALEYIGVNLSPTKANTGMLFDGTGTSLFNGQGTIISPVILGAAPGHIGMQFGTLTTLTQIYGGHINLNTTGGSICIYKTGTTSDTLLLFGTNCEGASTGLKVDTASSRAVWGYLRCDSGCNNGHVIDFTSATSNNMIWTDNPANPIDAGSRNSFQSMAQSSIHDDLWEEIVQPAFWALDDVQPGGTQTVLQFYHGGNAFLTTPGTFVMTSTGGLVWQNNGTSVASVDGSGNATFNGNLTVSGTKSFRIDHPLDPDKKYLYHAAVESPDMKNIYDGVITLGAKGSALVKLPPYFGALNRDFRYQLTCIGGAAPVYVAREIRDNEFVIAGGRPGLKVSWQVTGIRHDAYANAHRMVAEQEKPAEDQKPQPANVNNGVH